MFDLLSGTMLWMRAKALKYFRSLYAGEYATDNDGVESDEEPSQRAFNRVNLPVTQPTGPLHSAINVGASAK